ncbi:MAG: hypothetical protein J1F01_01800 [Oscillospiraceae bacterium]|nr:hypothetical protein [Oscillospiraceae bacterium]
MKRVYIILTSSLTVILAAVFFFIGYSVPTGQEASKQLQQEIVILDTDIAKINAETGEIQKQIDDMDTQLDAKSVISDEYMEYKNTHDTLVSEIGELKNRSAQLDAEIEQSRITLEEASGVKEEKKGRSYALEANKTYSCPNEIPVGRYTVSGSGTLVITAANGKIRATQNLDVSYNNTYTFNLADKERIKSSAAINITQLVTN